MSDEAGIKPARKAHKKQPIRIAKAIEYISAQPPTDMTSERDVLKWMGGGRVDPGTYALVRVMEEEVVIEAVPATTFTVKAKA